MKVMRTTVATVVAATLSMSAFSVFAEASLTGAGATFPYGKDPHDSNIRIAPSFPSLEDLKLAAEIFCVCVKLVSIDKLLEA